MDGKIQKIVGNNAHGDNAHIIGAENTPNEWATHTMGGGIKRNIDRSRCAVRAGLTRADAG